MMPLINTAIKVAPKSMEEIAFGEGEEKINKPPSAIEIFEEWSIQFLNKIFNIFSNQSAPAEKGRESDAIKPAILRSVFVIFVQQMSPELNKICTTKILNFISNNFLPNAIKQVRNFILIN